MVNSNYKKRARHILSSFSFFEFTYNKRSNSRKNNTLDYRPADLVTGGNRTNKFLEIAIDSTLPMMITKSDYLNELTITQEAGPAIVDEDFDITDSEYKDEYGVERYVLVTVAKSPITNNRVVFYYDRLFQDIIVVPNIAFLDLFAANFAYRLTGHRIGSGCTLHKQSPHQVLPNEKRYVFKLPEANEKIANTTLLARVPGIIPEHLVRNDIIEELLPPNKTINIIRNTVQPSCIINLGKATTIFKNAGNLPLFLLAQTSIREYKLQYVNNIDPKDNDILISLFF